MISEACVLLDVCWRNLSWFLKKIKFFIQNDLWTSGHLFIEQPECVTQLILQQSGWESQGRWAWHLLEATFMSHIDEGSGS